MQTAAQNILECVVMPYGKWSSIRFISLHNIWVCALECALALALKKENEEKDVQNWRPLFVGEKKRERICIQVF